MCKSRHKRGRYVIHEAAPNSLQIAKLTDRLYRHPPRIVNLAKNTTIVSDLQGTQLGDTHRRRVIKDSHYQATAIDPYRNQVKKGL